MNYSKAPSSLFQNFLLFLGFVIIWITFAPTEIGGKASYVMVNGISMEPNYHTGDLVIVRKTATYKIGDVVTYHDAEMGMYVIHRIIAINQSQFLIKGDNNSWVDAYHPSYDEIIGKQWLYIPKAGNFTKWVRQPIHLSLTVLLLGGVLMTGTISKPKDKNGKRKTQPTMSGMVEGLLYVSGTLLIIFLALTLFSFTKPLTRTADDIQYQQEGNYSYSAAATPSVYDGVTIQSGEPIFPKLTCFLNLGFSYGITNDTLQNVSGNYQMVARVMDEQSGWQRTIPLVAQTAFSGNTYSSVAPLDLCQLTTLINTVEAETGLRTNTYLVEITTNTTFTATASGQNISGVFLPTLAFKFDKVHFYLANTNAEANPMHIVQKGSASATVVQNNSLHILGFDITIYAIRAVALFGLGFSFLGIFLLGISLMRSVNQNEDTLIHLKYGNMILDGYEENSSPANMTVNVTSIDSLAKLAERQGTMILHTMQNNAHTYLVQGNGVTYRYAEGLEEKAPAIEPNKLENFEYQNNSKQTQRVTYTEPYTQQEALPKHKRATTTDSKVIGKNSRRGSPILERSSSN
ncbi:MAG: signal peptidase I [Anaerolineales bacterium]